MHHTKLTKCQILALTADNATNVDTLSDNLEEQVPSYLQVKCMWCFTHILNLVAKSLLRQFNITPNSKGPNNDDGDARNELSAAEKELLDLASDIDQEELTMVQQDNANDNEDGTEDDEDDEGLVNKVEELSEEEWEELKVHIHPVSHVLVKACTLTEDIPS